MPERLAVGGKIRALRRQHHLTQADLAQRAGISASYLNLIEHNRRTLGADVLIGTGRI
jgi:transcriptional regulator with XRE-family HTH domain